MNFKKISEEIQGAEGVILDGDDYEKILYIREDEVMRLILKFAYNIEQDDIDSDENRT